MAEQEYEISGGLVEKLRAVGIIDLHDVAEKWEELGKAGLEYLDVVELNKMFASAGLDYRLIPVSGPVGTVYELDDSVDVELRTLLHLIRLVGERLDHLIKKGAPAPPEKTKGETDESKRA